MKSQRNKAIRALTSAISFFQQGKLKPAEGRLLAAIKLDPTLADAHNNLGVLYHHKGEPAKALNAFASALALNPTDEETARNVASAALELEDHAAALPALRALVERQPQSRTLRLRLAETLANVGEVSQALSLTSALLIDAPDDGNLLLAKAQLLSADADHAGALDALRGARANGIEDARTISLLGACLERARFESFDDTSRAELLACLRSEAIESQGLARAVGELLVHEFSAWREAPTLETLQECGWTREPLLQELLTRAVNVNATLEAWFIEDRALLAAHWARELQIPPGWRELTQCLALQCWIDEYVWQPDPDFESLRPRLLEVMSQANAQAADDALLLWSLYASPSPHAFDAMPDAAAATTLTRLMRVTHHEPAEERQIAASIAESVLADDISSAVRAQYEQSPYPRWVELGAQEIEAPSAMLARTFPAYVRTQAPPAGDILIAGCGSGHHALQVALQNPQTPVLAIDLSIASLAHATRKARELAIDNVEFAHLDLLNVAELGRRFAVIESFGVLHHMREPAAGLATLRSVLLPGGAIKLGLYSATARAPVNAARERIAARALRATPDDIRQFRAGILGGHEAGLEPLLEATDFYATSTCRDLLFHVHEHQFTPPQLGALLAGADLQFLGFVFANRSIPKRYAAMFPADTQQTDLDSWYAFEREYPNTFARCFLFWAQAL